MKKFLLLILIAFGCSDFEPAQTQPKTGETVFTEDTGAQFKAVYNADGSISITGALNSKPASSGYDPVYCPKRCGTDSNGVAFCCYPDCKCYPA